MYSEFIGFILFGPGTILKVSLTIKLSQKGAESSILLVLEVDCDSDYHFHQHLLSTRKFSYFDLFKEITC